MSFRTENKRTGVSSPPLATTELRQNMRRLADFLPGPLIKHYFFALLGGCRHTKMGWPIRLDGCAYRVCVGCGIKRLFDEESFLSYGPSAMTLNDSWQEDPCGGEVIRSWSGRGATGMQ